MISKNFCSKGIIGQGLRRNLWIAVLSGVGFLLTLLLPVMMEVQHALEEKNDILDDVQFLKQQANALDMLGGQNFLVKGLFVTLAVVCGMVLFSYLHSRQKVDFYHSLPISRTRFFVIRYLMGALYVFAAYLIVLALTVACVYAAGFGAAIDWANLGGMVVCSAIVFLLLYSMSILAAVLCGNTIISLLLLVWMVFSPIAVYGMWAALCDKFYTTFYFVWDAQEVLYCPLIAYFRINGMSYEALYSNTEKSAVGLLAAFLVCAVLISLLALYLFRIRKSERAGTALAFEPIKLPIKVFMCLMMGTAVGVLFNLFGGSFWFWIGLAIGTILFHWIVEMIYAFDFRAIFAKPLHLAATLAALFALALCMQADFTGYDSWLPDENDLQAAALEVLPDEDTMLDNAQNITAVRRLAEIGVDIAKGNSSESLSTYSMEFTFLMKNGKTVLRQYPIPLNDETTKLLMQIRNSTEYKQKKWKLFQFDASPKDGSTMVMEFEDVSSENILGQIYDEQDKIRQILQTLREESLTRSLSSTPVMLIDMWTIAKSDSRTEQYAYAYVSDEDTRTLALIKELTGFEPTQLDSKKVTEIQWEFNYYLSNSAAWGIAVSITDPNEIETLMENAVNNDLFGYSIVYTDYSIYDYWSPDNYSVYAIMEDGTTIQLFYPYGLQPPENLIEKYRAQAAEENEQASLNVDIQTEDAQALY